MPKRDAADFAMPPPIFAPIGASGGFAAAAGRLLIRPTGTLGHSLMESGFASSPRRAVRAGLAAPLLALMLGACLSTGTNSNGDDFAHADPPDLMYNRGLALLNAGDARRAQEQFQEIDEQHPYSEYSRRSMILSAYLNFRSGKFQEAINDARRYVALFPASEDAAYAQYMIAESYFRQIPDVTREQGFASRSIEAFEEVVRRYPDSEYAEDARRKIIVAKDQLAGKEMQIGRYYLERGEYLGAVNRFRTVVDQYQTTRHVEEALHRLTEAYLALGMVREAQTAGAVLGHNFPDSAWYQDSYRLLARGGVQPDENRGSWISRAFRRSGSA
jgi:outer membrane protein assembly factor BamD